MKSNFQYIFLILVIFISSCSVKKRNYRNGYYVDWAHHKSHSNPKPKNESDLAVEKNSRKPESNSLKEAEQTTKELLSNKSNDIANLSFKKQPLLLNPDTCGDIIALKNGDRIIAKVFEINESGIRYKKCDNLSGPFYTVNRSAVYSITYTNGSKEVIEPEKAKPYNEYGSRDIEKTVHEKAIYSLILAILSLIILFLFGAFMLAIFSSGYVSILFVRKLLGIIFLLSLIPFGSIVLGKSATKAILLEPDKYRGNGYVVAAQYISIVVICCFILLGLIFLIIG